MFSLQSKTALITGSSRGLGLTIAQGLGKAGAKIILNGRNEESLVEARKICAKNGIDADYSIFDVFNEKQVIDQIGRIEKESGELTYWLIMPGSIKGNCLWR